MPLALWHSGIALDILFCPRIHSNGCWECPHLYQGTLIQPSLFLLSAHVITVLGPFSKHNDVKVVRIRHLSPQVSIILNKPLNRKNCAQSIFLTSSITSSIVNVDNFWLYSVPKRVLKEEHTIWALRKFQPALNSSFKVQPKRCLF